MASTPTRLRALDSHQPPLRAPAEAGRVDASLSTSFSQRLLAGAIADAMSGDEPNGTETHGHEIDGDALEETLRDPAAVPSPSVPPRIGPLTEQEEEEQRIAEERRIADHTPFTDPFVIELTDMMNEMKDAGMCCTCVCVSCMCSALIITDPQC